MSSSAFLFLSLAEDLYIGNKNFYLPGEITASQRLLQARSGIGIGACSLSYMLLIALRMQLRGFYRDITPTLLREGNAFLKRQLRDDQRLINA